MKKLITIILLFSLSAILAQERQHKDPRKFSKRFKELEKIKLLEMLELDEETAIKFFARRNLMKKKVSEFMEESKDLHNSIEEMLKNDEDSKDFVPLINEFTNIEDKMYKEQKVFFTSLDDILSEEQIAKLILFERKFKKDVRDLLIERGRRNFRKNKGEN